MDPTKWAVPFPVIVGALYAIVLLRAGATYALGRGVIAGATHTRLRRVVESDRYARAARLIDRWGPPIVSLSFLTVGLQTLVNLAAGVGRMPLRHYLPALALGGLMWAFIYATIGVVGVEALSTLHERAPWAAWLLAVTVVGGVGAYAWVRRRRTAQA